MTTKLVHGRYLVVDASTIIPSGCVFIHDDEIAEVGTFEELNERYQADEVIGSSEKVVVPGFVNGHGHGKGLTDFQLGTLDNTLETWKFRSQPTFDRYYDTLWRAIQLLESGVTTTMHNHSLASSAGHYEEFCTTIHAYMDSGIRVAFAPTLINQNLLVYGDNETFIRLLPATIRDQVENYVKAVYSFGEKEYFDAVSNLRKDFESVQVKIMHGPLSPQWCHDDSLRAVKKHADGLGMRIHIHVLQTMLQKIYGLKRYGKSLLEHLFDLGFLGENVTCGHSVWLTERDIDLLAETKTSVTHHASCNFRVRNGISPVFYLLKKGVKVGIGIDDKNMSDSKDFIEEMRLVSKLHRLPSHQLESEHLQPKDCFRMGTLCGAEVLGYSQLAGTIEKGKKADIVLIDLNRMMEPFLHAEHSIIDTLIYRGRGSDVDTVIVGGEVLVKDGKLTRIDREEVTRKLRESIPPDYLEATAGRKAVFDELKKHVVHYFEGWYDEFDRLEIRPYYLMNNRY